MSLSTDVLSRATPTRLLCRGGRWVLELTRLEAVDRDVFQPRLQQLEGGELILAALRRSEDGQHLATGAAQLMRGARAEEDRAFEASDGDWVPSEAPAPAQAGQSQVPLEASGLGTLLTEMRAELVVLRASHHRLRERVAALEAAQNGVVAPARQPRGSRARRRSEPPPGLAAGPGSSPPAAFAATQASPGIAPLPKPASEPAERAVPARVADAAPLGSLQDLVAAVAAEQPLPLLGLPPLLAVNECLSTLMDAAPKLDLLASEPMLWKLNAPKACLLLDDNGRQRGAVILDLAAATLLGAALLGLPRDEATRQISENAPSDDVLLATAEICNNLAGPINAVPKNDHVRASGLTEVDVGSLPQVRSSLNLGLEGGRVVVVMF